MTDKKHAPTDKADKLKKIEKQCEEYLRGWQRAQADYHNLVKETETKKQDWVKFAGEALLLDLLPIYDNLKLALSHVPETDKKLGWVVGLEHIKNQFKTFLEQNNVEEIKTVGEDFDPELHEAIADESDEKKENQGHIINKELKSGYKLNGKVLYPAKVVVE